MLRIGDFSQLAQVSVPALRHYDELGLLKPATVDKFTDYRYYSVDQLSRLNRILALKDLGLSLDQIHQLLQKDVPVSELRALLTRKQVDIHQQIQDEQARLARVDARLRQIEEDNSPPKYEIVLKTMPPQRVASARQIVPHVDRMGELRDLPLRELYDWLKRNRITDYDIEVMIYNITEYVEENIDMQSCVILGRGADQVSRAQDARVRVEILPAAEMATTVHHGYPSDVTQAIIALFKWIGTNGYRSCGPIRELHLNGREIDLCDAPASVLQSCVMEIQIPVETAS